MTDKTERERLASMIVEYHNAVVSEHVDGFDADTDAEAFADRILAALRREPAPLEREREVFAHYWTSGDDAVWGCPLCGSVCGHGVEWCEGDWSDDEDGGDLRHPRVNRPDGVLARVERLRWSAGEGAAPREEVERG